MQELKTNISFQYMKENCKTLEDVIKMKDFVSRFKEGKDVFMTLKTKKRVPTAEEIVRELKVKK